MKFFEPVLYLIGKPFTLFFVLLEAFGKFCLFHFLLFGKYFSRPIRLREILTQVEIIGVNSLGVIILTGVFTGLVLAIQMYVAFKQFGADEMMGYTIFVAVGKELGPVFTALMVTSRAISSMSAELGTMRVTEQIDALDVFSIDSQKYLLVPRILGAVIAMPILVLIFDLVANMGAYAISVYALDINPTPYSNMVAQYAKFSDFLQGVVKGVFFGFVVAWIGTYVGYKTKGGAKGVGIATTKAVVLSSVSIFLVNYLVSSFFASISQAF